MHQACQASGKEMEWVVGLWGDESTITYAESMKDCFTISRNNTTNMLYLHLNSLRTKDTAMHYCVRDTDRGRQLRARHKASCGKQEG